MEKERNDDLVILPSIPQKIVTSIEIILKFPTSKATAVKFICQEQILHIYVFLYITVYLLSSFLVVEKCFKSRPQYSFEDSCNILLSNLAKQPKKASQKD